MAATLMSGPGCMRLPVLGSAPGGVAARRGELTGLHPGLPQAALAFQPRLQRAEFPLLFCEMASLMALQALGEALCIAVFTGGGCLVAFTVRERPDGA